MEYSIGLKMVNIICEQWVLCENILDLINSPYCDFRAEIVVIVCRSSCNDVTAVGTTLSMLSGVVLKYTKPVLEQGRTYSMPLTRPRFTMRLSILNRLNGILQLSSADQYHGISKTTRYTSAIPPIVSLTGRGTRFSSYYFILTTKIIRAERYLYPATSLC